MKTDEFLNEVKNIINEDNLNKETIFDQVVNTFKQLLESGELKKVPGAVEIEDFFDEYHIREHKLDVDFCIDASTGYLEFRFTFNDDPNDFVESEKYDLEDEYTFSDKNVSVEECIDIACQYYNEFVDYISRHR